MDASASLGVTEPELARLRALVATSLDIEVSDIDLDTDLHRSGRMDSLAMVTLVTFLEDELGVRLDIDQIVPENFASVRRLTQLVAKARS
jgi:acyl carrier protein